jgi:hypothetical protein
MLVRSAARSSLRILLRTSCAATALLAAPQLARAACTPNPPQSYVTTTCSGAETNGLVVASDYPTVNVNAGATVTAPAGSNAIYVTSTNPYGSSSFVNVSGSVDGGGQAGIEVQASAVTGYYYSTQTASNITVAAGGSVSGTVGLIVTGQPANSNLASVNLINSGTVSGTGGTAILGGDPAHGYLSSILNTSSGRIGAIDALVNSVNNAGVIDGGGASALAVSGPINSYTEVADTTNTGTISNDSTSATISVAPNYLVTSIANSGTIANSGSGAALASSAGLSVQNLVGGVISTAGGVAIQTAGATTVNNAGTINGSILSGGVVSLLNTGAINGSVTSSAFSTGSSYIDTSGGGKINGSVTLGDGGNTLITDFGSSTAPISGISGTVDAGAGVNTLRLEFGQDTTLSAPTTLPATFQTLIYAIADGKTLTLAPGFSQVATINLAGPVGYGASVYTSAIGFVVNNANISTNGVVFSGAFNNFGYGPNLSLTNNAIIDTTLALYSDSAVELYSSAIFKNAGTINAIGGVGVSMENGQGANSGSITADSTGLYLYQSNFDNSGTVLSNAAVGLNAGYNDRVNNSGMITGATYGALLSETTLVNTGTISSTAAGVGLEYFSTLDNRAGGVVNGGVNSGGSTGTYMAKVINAGTINGDVSFGDGSNNVFIASRGGVLNGNLLLGTGPNTFVTTLDNAGPGAFAGVTGAVTGAGAQALRYLVDHPQSAVLAAPPAPFTTLGYELSTGGALTLKAPTAQTLSVGFSGTGVVDLTADLTQVDATILQLTVPTLASVATGNALTLTSRGVLTDVSDMVTYYQAPAPAVQIGLGSTFTNAGTIIARDLVVNVGAPPLAAVSGAGAFVNSGTILLDGAVGVYGLPYGGAMSVINSGTIGELVGGAASEGVAGAASITNTGTISTTGAAIDLSLDGGFVAATIVNSGTIYSGGASAITDHSQQSYAYYSNGLSTLINQTGGVVGTGTAVAIVLNQGLIDNAGSIIGSVDLGCISVYYCYTSNPSTYVARGGTLTGNLTFGSANDLFIALDGVTGVSGTVDGGAGVNTYGIDYSASTTVTAGADVLPASFQRQAIGASGAATVVTVNGPASGLAAGLLFFGDGTIVNTATVNSANSGAPANTVTLGDASGQTNLSGTLSFVNQGRLNDGVMGSVRAFDNVGVIGSTTFIGLAAQLTANSDTFSFVNSGAILGGSVSSCAFYYGSCPIAGVTITQSYGALTTAATVSNTGKIAGGVSGDFSTANLTFYNSGEISGVEGGLPGGPDYTTLQLSDATGTSLNATSVAVTNSGALGSGVSVTAATATFSFVNSGTIAGGNDTALSLAIRPDTYQQLGSSAGYADQNTASFTNSGAIGDAVSFYSTATSLTVANSGSISHPAPGSLLQSGAVASALSLQESTLGADLVAVTNSGAIRDDNAGSSAVLVTTTASAAPGGAMPATRNPSGPTSAVTVGNTGSMQADGGAFLGQGILYNASSATYMSFLPGDTIPTGFTVSTPATIQPAIALAIVDYADGPSSAMINNGAGGVISGVIANATTASAPLGGGGSTAIFASADTVSIVNDGMISGGQGVVLPTGVVFMGPLVSFTGASLAGAIQTQGSAAMLYNGKTGVITGDIALMGADMVANYGSIAGDVTLGDGGDSVIESLGATMAGVVTGGAGVNTLTFDLTGGGGLNAAVLSKFVNFGTPTFTGAGAPTLSGPLPLATLQLSNAVLTISSGQTLQTTGPISITTDDTANTVINQGAIAGGVSFGAGQDTLVNAGLIGGPVTFAGAGAQVMLLHGAAFGGPVSAGAGSLLVLDMGGSDATPDELNLSAFSGFASTLNVGGVAALSGTLTTGRLDVTGGRLIGRDGSTITAPTITVANGATFGSAGTVVGALSVAGVLSPGASPGTMTVNGSVALAGTSTSYFEFTPNVSDQLLVSGAVTIAPGATLTMVGYRPLAPGVTLNLIVAGGGITGDYSTITQPPTVGGVLRQTADELQLIGIFPGVVGATPAVSSTLADLNALVLSGEASPGLLAALPGLVTANGATNAAALARLNPEAYASAEQIGVENGLTVVNALRSSDATTQRFDSGLFTFAQGVGSWRRLDSQQDGASRADISSGGLLAGAGLGGRAASVGAFVGYLDSRQTIDGIGAHTSASGGLVGIDGDVALKGFKARFTLGYDGASATTTRYLPGGGVGRGECTACTACSSTSGRIT